MSEVATAPDAATVRVAVAGVADPELPPVTVGMLGMIHDLTIDDDGVVTVELLPTFAGCPATEAIAEDVEAAAGAIPGVRRVVVRFRYDPPWSSDRITAEGHERLRSFGIAPPDDAATAAADLSAGRGRLPLAGAQRATPCPYCGASDTQRESPFGPTPCRAIHYCNACRQPFEGFKVL